MADTSLRFIGWCPICEGDYKVRANRLVHHGYQRPGTGFIVGDCPGVHHPPYELSTFTCELYANLLVRRISETEIYLRELRADPPDLALVFDDYDVVTRRLRRYSTGGSPMIVTLTRLEAEERAAQLPPYERDRYSWELKKEHVTEIQLARLADMRRELRRMEKLIAEWPGVSPLRTVEEEIQHQEKTRAEREHARTVARDDKISAEVVKIRKRIDSAVRNKNAAALADIFTSQKIREVSGYRLTREQAIDLLERGPIWQAFGLVDTNGVYSTDTRVAIGQMREGIWTPRPGGGYDVAPLPWPAELGGGFAKSRR